MSNQEINKLNNLAVNTGPGCGELFFRGESIVVTKVIGLHKATGAVWLWILDEIGRTWKFDALHDPYALHLNIGDTIKV